MATDSVAARIAREVNRRATADEIRRYLDAPVTDEERQEVIALAAWFRRRYPHPMERLRYARRAYTRWLEGPRVDPKGPLPNA